MIDGKYLVTEEGRTRGNGLKLRKSFGEKLDGESS